MTNVIRDVFTCLLTSHPSLFPSSTVAVVSEKYQIKHHFQIEQHFYLALHPNQIISISNIFYHYQIYTDMIINNLTEITLGMMRRDSRNNWTRRSRVQLSKLYLLSEGDNSSKNRISPNAICVLSNVRCDMITDHE